MKLYLLKINLNNGDSYKNVSLSAESAGNISHQILMKNIDNDIVNDISVSSSNEIEIFDEGIDVSLRFEKIAVVKIKDHSPHIKFEKICDKKDMKTLKQIYDPPKHRYVIHCSQSGNTNDII